jgi:hypothetical protein
MFPGAPGRRVAQAEARVTLRRWGLVRAACPRAGVREWHLRARRGVAQAARGRAAGVALEARVREAPDGFRRQVLLLSDSEEVNLSRGRLGAGKFARAGWASGSGMGSSYQQLRIWQAPCNRKVTGRKAGRRLNGLRLQRLACLRESRPAAGRCAIRAYRITRRFRAPREPTRLRPYPLTQRESEGVCT